MSDVEIRMASVYDAPRLLEIYAYYVEHTAISFEYDVPTLQEFQQRIARVLERHPYLVAELDGEILGYAYASPLIDRAAYNWSAEVTIYLDKNARGKGIGPKLYAALEDALKAGGIRNLYACIGVPTEGEADDAYINRNSQNFHAHMGYHLVGTFQKCGFKGGRTLDMVYMEKFLS